MNYAKILSISVIVLVIGMLLTIVLSMSTINGAYADRMISEYQMVVNALGLSAIALALLRFIYKSD